MFTRLEQVVAGLDIGFDDMASQIEIGIFKPGDVEDANSVFVDAMGPDVGTPDACPADLNDDGFVNVQDLILVLINYGTANPEGDANDDGVVGVQDLLDVIIGFGVCEGD